MKKYSQIFSITTVVYLFALVLTTLTELFMMPDNSAVKTSLIGIKISNHITKHNITTTFSPTWRVIVSYLVFLGIGCLIGKLMLKKRKK